MWRALQAMSDARGSRISVVGRLLIEEGLRARGLLQQLRDLREFEEGRDAFRTPWGSVSRLIWFSDRKVVEWTWERVLNIYMHQPRMRLADLAKASRVRTSEITATYVYFDRWRRSLASLPVNRSDEVGPGEA